MASVSSAPANGLQFVGELLIGLIADLGDLGLFALRTFGWMLRRRPSPGTLLATCYSVGVRSVPVVAITGTFIGMVLAVQSYYEFQQLGLATRLGALINISVVTELGPVLAATMIAGRVGSAMAAELGTMRITEQIDALECLGANPIHYLVVPRLLACVLLNPLLTVMADIMGILGGAVICIGVYHVDAHFYWARSREFVAFWDVNTGLIKSLFFGMALALISCHRGFNCRPGAEGVGRAATESFVASFIAILAVDFFLTMFLNNLAAVLWPTATRRLF
jgi:phospholipid/cholesterol/gamma-HCH transport system permease protein